MPEVGTAPPAVTDARTATRRLVLSLPRRMLGLAIILLAALPVYRVLDHPDTGLAGRSTTELVATYAAFVSSGALLVLASAILAGRFLSGAAGTAFRWCTGLLMRPRLTTFAVLTGVISALLTAVFSLTVLDGKPNMIDALAQTLHARFIAEGNLAGPATDWNGFWHIQNSVITEHGWVSQYPPGHLFLIAGALRIGLPWIVGPLCVGLIAFLVTLLAQRLWPHDRTTARLAALLTAVSTFVICIGASYLNHVPVATLLTLAAWFMWRGRVGGAGWAAAAGLAVGCAFTMRPLTALAVAFGIGVAIWLEPRLGLRKAAMRLLKLGTAAAAGAALPVALLMLYNRHFFGSPLTFGYNVALGPRMGLGFGRDPWGNLYGPIEALGYTAADLTTLGMALLETPFSAVIVVGLFLLLVPRIRRAERLLIGWAMAPLFANALYWHHGLYMGPRMVYEAAPAWIMLFAVACMRAIRAAPERWRVWSGFSPKAALQGAFLFALAVGLLYLAPQRAASYGGEWLAISRVEPPRTATPSLVFVHDAWIARLGMQLAADGMRLDSVETAVRQNPTCTLQELVNARATDPERAARILAGMDMEPRATNLPPLRHISLGNTMRLGRDGRLSPECARQVNADRLGILDIAPLLWQGDLPDAAPRGELFVRDFGPERNAALIARMPDRTPWVFMTPSDGADPVLLPYQEGMSILWGVR